MKRNATEIVCLLKALYSKRNALNNINADVNEIEKINCQITVLEGGVNQNQQLKKMERDVKDWLRCEYFDDDSVLFGDFLNYVPEKINIECDFETRTVEIDGIELTPDRSLKVCNHSPDGFNWGYGGSGPAQLALAILLLYLPVYEAFKFYQDFKFKTIAGFPRSDFQGEIYLRSILQELKQK